MLLNSAPWTVSLLHPGDSAPWTAPGAPTNKVCNQEDRQESYLSEHMNVILRAGNESNTSFSSFPLPLFFISLFQDASWTRPHHFSDLENYILTRGPYIYLVAFIREWFLKCLKTVESPALFGERFLTYHNISDVGMKQALDKSHIGHFRAQT